MFLWYFNNLTLLHFQSFDSPNNRLNIFDVLITRISTTTLLWLSLQIKYTDNSVTAVYVIDCNLS